MSKGFHLGDILSITTGRLMSPRHMDGVHAILDYMTGDQLFSHQLLRAMDECQPHLAAQHPQLAAIEPPEEFDGKEHVDAWLAEQVAIYGEHLSVEPLAAEDHTRIHPLHEFGLMGIGKDRVIPIVLDKD